MLGPHCKEKPRLLTGAELGRETRDYKFEFTVEAFEEVATPAGAFKVFRIRRTSPHDHYIVWYEPMLGIEIKRDWERYANHPDGPGTNQMELLSYSINK